MLPGVPIPSWVEDVMCREEIEAARQSFDKFDWYELYELYELEKEGRDQIVGTCAAPGAEALE